MLSSKGVIVLTTLILSVFLNKNTFQAQNQYPVPAGNPNQLFYLQRTENTNTVIYEVKQTQNNLNVQNPLHIFWIMYTRNQKHQDLSDFEKEFAYGIKIKTSSINQCEFTLVAYPKITLTLMADANKKYQVYVTPQNQQIILNSVFIQTKKSFLKIEPEVEFIQFNGISVTSGKPVTEKIIP